MSFLLLYRKWINGGEYNTLRVVLSGGRPGGVWTKTARVPTGSVPASGKNGSGDKGLPKN
jgi:hypothetical protein